MSKQKKMTFQRVTPKRVIDEISDQIKEMIYSGLLKPDDRLPSEKDLAASFGTGRMTVREALRMLEAIGLIYIKQGAEGGPFVKKLDASALTSSIEGLIGMGNVSLYEITEARISVESLLIESAIKNATETHIKALEDNIASCRATRSELGDDMAPMALKDFHILLAESSDNQLLKYFLHSLIEVSNHYIYHNTPNLPLSPTHIKEHEGILDNFKAQKTDAARHGLKNHLLTTALQIDGAMETKDEKIVRLKKLVDNPH